jgi:hypothetical protein
MDVGVEVATGGLLLRAAVGLLPPRAVASSPAVVLALSPRRCLIPVLSPPSSPFQPWKRSAAEKGAGVEQEGLMVGGERESAIGGEREARLGERGRQEREGAQEKGG